ncbi:MAG TPA: DUF2959 domain-containing protein [Desulfobulbaceae bacterium]|nr:DUF2959 domain-containing protein [Desulfobulbaceae bacterium]
MRRQLFFLAALAVCLMAVSACSSAYYGAMEKVGVHKRDIMVDRVEVARDAQSEAQEQFKSALEQFGTVVRLKDSDLKRAYDKLNGEYEDSQAAAKNVSARIGKIEDVSEALFSEWQQELGEYQSQELRRESETRLRETKARYRQMIGSMRQAEKSMEPVLRIFHDNVLFLKHNLNAQAIGSLRGEFDGLREEIARLTEKMNQAIAESNRFIAGIKE